MNARAPTGRQVLGAWGAPVVLFAAYALAMTLLALSSVIDYRNARDLEESGNNVSRTIEGTEKLRQIGNIFFIAESSQRGYIITGDPAYLAPYREMQQRIPVRLAEIAELFAKDPMQSASVVRLRELAAKKFSGMDQTLDAFRDQGQAKAMALVASEEGMNTMVAVRDLIGGMLTEESRMLSERRATAAKSYSGGLTKAMVASAVVALALSAFYFLMYRFLRQRDAALRVVEATNAELEQRVIDRTADLSHLSRHLLNVREHEKKIIARDLHDEFGSYLTAINMDVSRARDKIATTNPDQAAKLERTLGLLSSAIEMKRQLISELRPSLLDNLGLGPALEQYIDEWSRRTGIAASFDHQGELQSDEEGSPIAIFRVFQEALTNIAKHSGATRVAAYAYRVDDAIEFEIADDGVGLTVADRSKPGTHGLLGIRERVLAYDGHLELLNGPSGGTILRGTMPCHLPAIDERAVPYALQFA
jgi:signal transduction histidine kinase